MHGTMMVEERGGHVKDIRALAIKTDTALAVIYGERRALQQQEERLRNDVLAWSGAKKTSGYARRKTWDRTIEEALATYDNPNRSYDKRTWERLVVSYREITAKIATLSVEIDRLQEVWVEHRWTRAFLVTNSNGHVHSSMACHTCRPTTWFNWLPEYSGASEEQIVSDAGERACTVCYPSAPVNVLSRPTKIFSEDEKRIAREREERAAAKAAREAKRAERKAKIAAR